MNMDAEQASVGPTFAGAVDAPVRGRPFQKSAEALLASWAFPLIGAPLAWLILTWPWLSGAAIIPWDAKLEFYPTIRFLSDAWHNGQSALWNPYTFGGYPLVADPQSMIFSPLMAALAWLVEKPSMRAVDTVELLHLLVGAIFLILFFRARRWAPAGALLAALVYMIGATVAGRLQHTLMVISYGWLPVALFCLEMMLARASLRWAVAFGLAGAVLAVDRDQVALLACAMLLGYAAWNGLTAPAPPAWLRPRLWPLLLAGGIGAGLLVVPVLLTLQFASLSNRPEISLAEAFTGSLSPVNFLTMVVPDFFGSLGDHRGYWGPTNPRWPRGDWTDRCTNYLYIGIVPLILLAWHGIAAGRLKDREVRFFVIAAIAALLYAVGRWTPAFEFMYRWVPGVAEFRRPADAAFLVTFNLAVLSGWLFGRLVTEGSPRRVSRGGMALLGALVAIGLVAAFALAGRYDETARVLPRLGFALVGILACAMLLAHLATARSRAPWAMVALAVLALDLRSFNVATELNAATPSDRQELAKLADGSFGTALHQLIVDNTTNTDRPRVSMLGLGGYWQKSSLMLGLENSQGYGPLRLGDYERLTGIAQNSHENRRKFTPFMDGFESPLGRLLGVRYVVTTTAIENLDPTLEIGDFPAVQRYGQVRVYENPEALPRVMFVRRGVIADRDKVLETGHWPLFDPAEVVLLDEQPAAWTRWARKVDNSVFDPGVEILSYGHTEIRLAVANPLRGYVVLNDLHYPGWHAWVDGKQVPVRRANLLFRAIAVPPGRHEIILRYQPFSLANLKNAAAGLFN